MPAAAPMPASPQSKPWLGARTRTIVVAGLAVLAVVGCWSGFGWTGGSGPGGAWPASAGGGDLLLVGIGADDRFGDCCVGGGGRRGDRAEREPERGGRLDLVRGTHLACLLELPSALCDRFGGNGALGW